MTVDEAYAAYRTARKNGSADLWDRWSEYIAATGKVRRSAEDDARETRWSNPSTDWTQWPEHN